MAARKQTENRRSSLPNGFMTVDVNSGLGALLYREELYRRRLSERSSIEGNTDTESFHERRESSESRTNRLLKRRRTSVDILLDYDRRTSIDRGQANIKRRGSLATIPSSLQKSINGLLSAFRVSSVKNDSGDSLENLDLLVCQYNRTLVDSGFRDSSLSSRISSLPGLGFKTDTAAITTRYCHVNNILYLKLECTNFESWDVDESRKICGKMSLMPDKSQSQKIKPMSFKKDIIWNKEFQFSDLTMKQLETGIIQIKFYTFSRFMVTKRNIAGTCIELRRHDYRKSNKVYAIFEKCN